MFKEYLLENVSKTLPKFLARLSRTPAVQWPNCKKLVKLAAIIPFGNELCESGFSFMNYIKGATKAAMSIDTLDVRMFLHQHAPSPGSAEYESVVTSILAAFWRQKTRHPKRARGAAASHEARRKKRKVRDQERRAAFQVEAPLHLLEGSHAAPYATYEPTEGEDVVNALPSGQLDASFVAWLKQAGLKGKTSTTATSGSLARSARPSAPKGRKSGATRIKHQVFVQDARVHR